MVAVVAAAALALSGCTPIFSLIESLRPDSGAPSTEFTDFSAQQPRWGGCGDGMQCADVYAPVDWEHPDGDRITLRLVKQPALGGNALGTLFVNPGGPGSSGASYVASYIDGAVGQAVQQQYDVIGWDPRGVGASSAVSCLAPAEKDEFFFGLGDAQGLEVGSDEWIAVSRDEAAEFGQACLDETGALLGHVDTASTVQDLDMLRAIVGDETLNYLGYSYGTYIGARYADAYPERVGRLVLDGALDPTTTEAEVVREQTIGFEAALRAYVTDCLTRSDCPFTGSVDDGMRAIGGLLDAVEADPLVGSDGRMVGSGTMLTAIITPLYSQQSWPYLNDLFVTVANGDADTALLLADFYYDRNSDGSYSSNLMEAFIAINCLDYPSSRELDVAAMRAEAAELDALAPTIGRFQGYGDILCSAWPFLGVETREPATAEGADPILVVGTTGDPATPYRWAVSLAEQLSSGVLVTYHGEGHTAYGEHPCINAVVEDYLLSGVVPASDPNCAA